MSERAEANSKTRIAWVDILRFLGMTLIYWGHLGPPDNVVLYIFAHHVPLFFFISGFFAIPKRAEGFLPFLVRKTRSIVLPYLFFTLLYYGLQLATGSLTFSSLPAALLILAKGVRNEAPGPLWFFTCLFAVSVFYEILRRFAACMLTGKRRTVLLFALSAAVYVCGILFLGHEPAQDPAWIWNVDSAFVYLFYYALGSLLFPVIKDWKFAAEKTGGKVFFLLLFALSVLFGLCMLLFGVPLTAAISDALHAGFGAVRIAGAVTAADALFELYGLLCAIILIFMELCFSRLLAVIPGIGRFLAFVGKDSLYHCGNELVIKYFGGLSAAALGFSLVSANAGLLLLYSILCMIVLTFTLNLAERLLLGRLFRNGAVSLSRDSQSGK